jgi:hypothetical protein
MGGIFFLVGDTTNTTRRKLALLEKDGKWPREEKKRID